jgi:hypothetical protein
LLLTTFTYIGWTTPEIDCGYFTGNSQDNRYIEVGFEPQFVWLNVYGQSYYDYWKIPELGDTTLAFCYNNAGGSGAGVNKIYSLDSSGFTVSGRNEVNWNNITVHYMAIRDESGNYFKTGTYVGDGTDDRTITTEIDNAIVIVQGSNQYAVIRTSSMSGDSTFFFQDDQIACSNLIQSLSNGSFQIGDSDTVNANGVDYYWAAFKESEWFDIGEYQGNQTDFHEISLDMNSRPGMFWSLRVGDGANDYRMWSHSWIPTTGDLHPFGAHSWQSSVIYQTSTGKVSLYDDLTVNALGEHYKYVAFRCPRKFYVHGTKGDNSNTGLSWDEAFLNPYQVAGEFNLEPSDTIVLSRADGVDAGLQLSNNDSGCDGSPVVWIDTLAYENASLLSQGITDTSLIQGSFWELEYGDINFSGNENYHKFFGIYFKMTENGSVVLNNTNGDPTKKYYFEQCKFNRMSATSGGDIVTAYGNDSVFTYFNNCLFLSDASNSTRLFHAASSQNIRIILNNCTIYYYANRIFDYASYDSGWLEIYNSIIYNTTTSTNYGILYWCNGAIEEDIFRGDSNIWYRSSAATHPFVWEDGISSFSAWQDSTQRLDPSNEVNSLFQDPDLLYVTTTCVPNVPVTCPDLGYGTDIGWYQLSSTSRSQIILIQ